MFRSVRSRMLLVPAVLALAIAAPGTAAAQLFDFESETATFTDPPGGARPGALTSLVMTSGGVTVTIYRSSGAGFDIVENTGGQGGKPGGWGLNSLDPFHDFTTPDFFIADFSVPVTVAKIQTGDYGGDGDSAFLMSWTGLGGTGALVGSDAAVYGSSSFPTISTLLVLGGGPFSSITFGGGIPSFPNSLFWDNLEVFHPQAVPEPASMVLLGAGLPVVGLLLRRRKKSA